MKEILIRTAGVYGTRYFVTQKNKFLQTFGDQLQYLHYDAKVEHDKSKTNSNILIVGNPKSASQIFVTGFDTGTTSVIPNFRYYPFNNKKSQKQKLIDSIVRFILSILVALLDFFVLNKISFIINTLWLRIVVNVIAVLAFTIIVVGLPSSYNMQRNTAAVSLLYKAGGEIKSNRKFCMIYADKTANNGFVGYAAIAEILSNYIKKNYVIIDSIAYGEKLYLLHRNEDLEIAEKIASNFVDIDIELIGVNNNEIENTPIMSYQHGFMLVAGQKDKDGDVYCLNTRNSSTDCDLDRLNKILKGIKRIVNSKQEIKEEN